MKKAVYILFVSLCLNIDAQNYQWARGFGGTHLDYAYSMTTDALGNVYVTGTFQDTVDFDPGLGTATLSSVGMSDIYIAKYTTNGTYLWAKAIGGSMNDLAFSIALDAANNVYIAGYFNSTVDFDPGAGTATLSAISNSNMFFAKYDANGNYLWAKATAATTATTGAREQAITTDTANNLYIAGYFYGIVDFDPGSAVNALNSTNSGSSAFFAKYDAGGNFLWAKTFANNGITRSVVRAIALGSGGDIYVAGNVEGTGIDFDAGLGSTSFSTSGSDDAYVAKYDANGNYIWANIFGGSLSDLGGSLVVDATDNIYVTGTFMATVDFDPSAGTTILTSAGIYDAFFAKYDANGNFLWANAIGGSNSDGVYDVCINNAANSIYILFMFQGTNIDFDPSPTGVSNLSSAGFEDAAFAEYDTDGNYIWANAIGGTGTDYGYSIALDASDNVYIAGFFSGTADFDPSVNTVSLNSAGSYDAFIAKYGLCHTKLVHNSQTICVGSSYTFNGHTYSSTGVYNDTLHTLPLNCDSIIITELNVLSNQSTITINSSNPVVCPNNTVALSASGAGSYTWSTGAQTASLIVSPANTTQYFVSSTDINGCVVTSPLITVTILPAPTLSVNASHSFTLCSPQQQTLTVSGAYSYVWKWGTTAWATSTFLIVNPMVTTQYTITGTGENGGCSSSKVVTVSVGCVGIEELSVESGKLRVYPNPVEEILNVELEMINGEQVEIYVYDVFGNTVIHHSIFIIHNSAALNVRELKSGIYFIKIGNEVRKFIKE